MQLRVMNINDYDSVMALWRSIEGFYIRNIDDSFEGMRKFLLRNPTTNTVAVLDDRIIGSVLCGYDGRCAYFYHVCVHKDHRHKSIGRQMVEYSIQSLKNEGATHINLIAFKTNEIGNLFWHELGWNVRSNANLYEYILDVNNTKAFTY